jgi:hypothetical protein
MLLYWIKRNPDKAMILAGFFLLIGSGAWITALHEDRQAWWFFKESVWFRKNWRVFLNPLLLCAPAGSLLIMSGWIVSIVRRKRQAGRPPILKQPG